MAKQIQTPGIESQKHRVFITFVYNHSRQERWQEFQRRQGPDEFMYGASHFAAGDWEVTFVERDLSKPSTHRWWWLTAEKIITKQVGMGFSLYTALDHLQQLKSTTVIISTADAIGLPIAFLKWVRILRTPLIYISQGLTDRLEQHPLTISLYRPLMKQIERVLVFGEGAVEPFRSLFDLPADQVQAIPFGVDEHFWTPASDQKDGEYILSIGSDQGRDYPTLLKSIEVSQPLHIITRQKLPTDLVKLSVTVTTEHSNLELRELYRRARLVVIPLQNIAQPSGQSATLQAMACGKAVILTKTKGLWDPVNMRHSENCYLVPPNDVPAMRHAIQHFLAHPEETQRIGQNARRSIERHYTSRHLGDTLKKHIESILYSSR